MNGTEPGNRSSPQVARHQTVYRQPTEWGATVAYTLGQAARATGKAKPTIAKAIQTGRISASRAADGSWAIDPAELHRVYPMTGQANGKELRHLPGEVASAPLTEVLAERDRLVAEQAETIRDSRQRLDAEAEARRQEAEERRRLTAILADQRAAPARRWWPWTRRD